MGQGGDHEDQDGQPRVGEVALRRVSPRLRVLFALLLAAWCVASFTISAQSDPESFVGVHLHLPDKVEHGIEYAVGGFLAAGAIGAFRRRFTWAAAVAFCALWGLSDEIHQSFVPGRDSSGLDLAADVAGAGLGALSLITLRGRAQSPVPSVDESNHGDPHEQARG